MDERWCPYCGRFVTRSDGICFHGEPVPDAEVIYFAALAAAAETNDAEGVSEGYFDAAQNIFEDHADKRWA